METDSDEDTGLRTDEYGDRFEDYGFLARAEEHRKAGNSDFQKQRYEKALREYDSALDKLLTVAYDKSIVIGERKWDDVVKLRSTIHLNKSTCYFKLKSWQESAEEARSCLYGNVHEELMYTDPQIRAKVREAEVFGGVPGATYVEQRLPRNLRGKAWFRLSRCYTNLLYVDRAREALSKALALCDDKELRAEMTQHAERLKEVGKRQAQKQRHQFKGFFDKLQDQGGYVDSACERKARWESLDYEAKLKYLEELDDSDDEDVRFPAQSPASLPSGVKRESAVERERIRRLNLSFEDYLERLAQGEDVGGAVPGQDAGSAARPAALEDEAPMVWPAGDDGPYVAAEVLPERERDTLRREQAWRDRQREREVDELEDEELRKARERLAKKQLAQRRGRIPDDTE